MLPGPVFNVELLTSARQRRYFAVRTLYGLILLLILWISSWSLNGRGQPEREEYTINELSQFAIATFSSFSGLQGAAVLALTPALVAGAIADEKQRKTLHYLLASRLTGGEIVLGKLLARMLHVTVLLAIGLPVMSLLGLFGGVDPTLVLCVYAGTATTAFFLAALSILVSTISKRARDAIIVVYLLELCWLTLPPLIAYPIKTEWPAFYSVIGPVNFWIYPTHPGSLFEMATPGGNPWKLLGWMCGLQVAYGFLFVTLAVWRLRPGFRNEGAGRHPLRSRLPRLLPRQGGWRLLPRPACGDDAMRWKELHVGRLGGITKLVSAFVGLILLALLSYWTLFFAPPSFAEVASYGYGWSGTYASRLSFNMFLRIAGGCLYVLVTLGVASAAAGGVTGEKEGDTWTSLVTTDLTGTEILRAKMIGAAWSMRGILGTMAGLWLIGLVAGAVHPIGLFAIVVETAVFLWFAAALGTAMSMWSKSTTRALGWTIATLVFLNGGYLMCCLPFRMNTPLVALGCTPFAHGLSLLSYRDLPDLLNPTSGGYGGPFTGMGGGRFALLCAASPVAYALAAILLTTAALGGFDRAVDRPDRSRQTGLVAAPKPKPDPPSPVA